MKKKVVSGLRLGLPFCLTLTAPTVALAQAIEGQVEDVVVSSEPEQPTEPPNAAAISQSQVQQVQSSPVAATVVTQQQLQALQINDLQAAEKLQPSLNIKFGNVRNIAINVRGFGAASSNATDAIFGGTPIYLNGVYQPFVGQAVFDIPDLAGVEVLKGPQATAGGQDNTGGVVNITTELPSFVTQQKGEFQYGSYNQFLFRGSATGAIADSDWAAFRLSVFGQDQEGYLDSTTSNERYGSIHDKGALAQILLKPNEDLTALLSLYYSTVTESQVASGFAGVVPNYTNGAAVPNNFYARSARINWPVPWAGTLLSTYTTSGFGWQNTAIDTYEASAKVDYNLNGFTFDSVTAATEWEFHPHNGYTTTPGVPYDVGSGSQVDAKSVEEDFKVSSPKGGPLDVTAGTFLFWDLLVDRGKTAYGPLAGAYYGSTSQPAIVNNTAYNYLMNQAFDNPSTEEIAPYAQSVWHATSDFDVTTGVRYSYNYKNSYFDQWTGNALPIPAGLTTAQINQIITDRNGLIGAPRAWDASTHQGMFEALATATYKFTPDAFGYVTVSQGGRAGGPNPATGNLPLNIPTTVQPERLDNYEVGVKSNWFDQRLLVNLDAFTMYDHNYITYESYVQGATPVSYLANAKLADSRGVELDVRAQPIDGLQSYFSLVYDDAFYGSFTNSVCPFEVTGQTSCDLTGKPLSLIPKFTIVGGAEYSQHLGNIVSEIVDKPVIGYFGADYTWQSSFYSGTDDSIYSKINPYGILDLHAGVKFEDGSWDLVGWAHNALNKHYFISVAATTAGEITGAVGEPLMVGFTLRAKMQGTDSLVAAAAAATADPTPTGTIPTPPPALTWAGLYLGGQIGFAWENDHTTTYNIGPVGTTPVVTGIFPSTANADGVVGGAHLGYNWQINKYVVGLEGEIDGVGLTGAITPVSYVSLYTNLYLQGALLGRIGYAFDNILLYANGGGVEGLLKNSYTVLGTLSALPEAHSGWTVGGGVEYAVDDHWSARIEYRHSDFGRINETQIVDFVQAQHHVEENQVKLGFSYRIPPAPPAPPPAPAGIVSDDAFSPAPVVSSH